MASLRVPSASARVPDVRIGVRAPVVRVLAVRVRCEQGGRGASASVDATKLDPHLVLHLHLQLNCTNFTSRWSRHI